MSSSFNPIASPITAATNETLARNDLFPASISSAFDEAVAASSSDCCRTAPTSHPPAAATAAAAGSTSHLGSSSSSSRPPGGVVQAAGHGLLRIDPDRDGAIVKPTTRQECVTYECMRHDAAMAQFVKRFVPRYFSSWPMRFVVPGSKFTHEVSLGNLCRLTDEQVMHWRGEINMRLDPTSKKLSWVVHEEKSTPLQPPLKKEKKNLQLIYQSPPCVLDLKIGRYRHTKTTPLRKYMRQMRKDAPTTARSVGMRICGVKHCRGILESFLTMEQVLRLERSRGGDGGNDADDDDDDEKQKREAVELRRARRAAMRRHNEKKLKHDESDSEIMQLPKAMEQAENKNKKNGASSSTSTRNTTTTIDPDLLQWSEDKIFGRNCNPDELMEALAMFCTLLVAEDDAEDENKTSGIGRPQLCKDDKSAPLRFDPVPEQPLLDFFQSRVTEMIHCIEQDRVLERYSFASASILFLHRWRVLRDDDDDDDDDGDGGGDKKTMYLEIDADMRLVDFSSSGPIDLSLARLGTAHNEALREGDLRAKERQQKQKQQLKQNDVQKHEEEEDSVPLLPHPAAAPNMVLAQIPKSGVMPLFHNEIIEFSFGLSNLKTALDQLCAAGEVFCQQQQRRRIVE